MKIWIKLLAGSILGGALGFLLPYESQKVLMGMLWLENFALRFGRYAALPLMFFSLVMAIYELRANGEFWKITGRSFLVMLGGAPLIIGLGMAAAILFSPARIPIMVEEQVETALPRLSGMLLNLFPSNLFTTLTGEGLYLFPAWLLAFFLAVSIGFERSHAKPLVVLGESLSRVFYHIVTFFSEILGVVIIVLAAYWAVRYHTALEAGVFRDFILFLTVLSLVLIIGVFPLILFLVKRRGNPWPALYGSLAPGLAGFFSGDINFTLPVLFIHVKENLGVQRHSGAITVSLFSIFGRAGSAMVAVASFIVITKSYSSLDMPVHNLIAIGLQALLISFLLGENPANGAYTALAVLCTWYGSGFEAGYLILKPIAFYLAAVGTFLDVMFCSFASYIVGRLSGYQEDKSIRYFI